jgi:hypothetical protein
VKKVSKSARRLRRIVLLYPRVSLRNHSFDRISVYVILVIVNAHRIRIITAFLNKMTYHRGTVGPVAIVISAQPLTGEQAQWVTRTINAFNVLQSDGGIVHYTIVESAYQRRDDEVTALQNLIGAPLSHEIVLACKRNSQMAHRKLAQLSIRLARQFGGVVDLTDTIDDLSRAHTVTGWTTDGKPFNYHVTTPDWLETWLGHPRFRMAT